MAGDASHVLALAVIVISLSWVLLAAAKLHLLPAMIPQLVMCAGVIVLIAGQLGLGLNLAPKWDLALSLYFAGAMALTALSLLAVGRERI